MNILFFIVIIFTGTLNAQEFFQIYRPSKPFPQEFVYLYESAQINNFKNGDQGKVNFKELTQQLDHFCHETRPEEITLYFKTVIYKKFLEANNSKAFDFELNKSVMDKIAEILAKNKESRPDDRYLSISEWLVSAVFYDLKNIISDPLYSTYKLAREQKSVEGMKIYNKIGILAPLISMILEFSPNEFNNYTSVVSLAALETIKSSIDIFSKLMPKNSDKSQDSAKKENTTSCFKILNIKLATDKARDMETILQKIEAPTAPDMIIKNHWLPKSAPPDYPTPDPNYSPPAQLPKPINDWN